MLALLFTLGLRVTELTRLNVGQVDLTSALLVAVRRKGDRIQDLPLAPGAAIALQHWMSERHALASPTESALFVSRSGLRLSARSVQRLFARLCEQIGTRKHATPHTVRHSFITLALTRGADVTVVSRVVGHASVTTTMRYRHLLDVEPRAAVGLVGAAILGDLRPANEAAAISKEIPMSASASEAWTNNASPANDTLDVQGHLDDAA
jgi:site-specific recombinase XerC